MMVRTIAGGAGQLLDESPNFLAISKSINPETGRVLECVDKRPAVIVMVVDRNKEKGLFVKQYRTGSKSYIWECPAGVIEEWQTPTEAVYAKLRQEIGLEQQDILTLEKVGEVYSSVGWTNEIKHLYIAQVEADVNLKEQRLDDGESLSYEWKTFEEVESDPLNTIMPEALFLLVQKVKEVKGTSITQKHGVAGFGASVTAVDRQLCIDLVRKIKIMQTENIDLSLLINELAKLKKDTPVEEALKTLTSSLDKIIEEVLS